MKIQTKQNGFTLVELMVTIAVLVVTLAIGIPAWDSMLANNRAVSQANMFVTAINLAKSEAISQGMPVTVCANASATNVTESSLTCATSGTNTWANGWFVFQDPDNDSVRDSGETVLKLWQALEPGSNIDDGGRFNIRYTSTGQNSGTAATFELTQDNTKGNQTRCLYLNTVGQIRVEKAACP